MPVAAKRYADELLKEINADREAHGKARYSLELVKDEAPLLSTQINLAK